MARLAEVRLAACGDVAVAVELGEEISAEVNARVLALDYLIGQRRLPGIVETVPSFRSLLVYYDPTAIAYDDLVEKTLDRLAAHLTTFIDLDRLLSRAR